MRLVDVSEEGLVLICMVMIQTIEGMKIEEYLSCWVGLAPF